MTFDPPEIPEPDAVEDLALEQVAKAQVANLAQPNNETGHHPEAVLITLSDVAPEEIAWDWPGVIPAHRFSMCVADPGSGKSLFACDVAARRSRGRAWPDGTPGGHPVDVIILAAEDSPGDYRLRLDAADADVSRCHILESVRSDGEDRQVTLADIAAIRDAVEQIRRHERTVGLIILDTIGALLAPGVDDSSNGDVRVMLRPLAALASDMKVTVIGIHHLRKGAGSGLHRTLGSVGWTAAARAVLAIARDPDEKSRRLLLMLKSNYSAEQPDGALAFGIEPDEQGRPRLLWHEDRVDIDVDIAMSPELTDGTTVTSAAEWLRASLAGGPISKKKLLATAKTEGIVANAKALERAAKRVPVYSTLSGFPAEAAWSLTPSSDSCGKCRRTGF